MAKTLTLVFAFLLSANIISHSAFAQATFSPKTDFTANFFTSGISVGDFNGDGKQDFAAVNNGSDNVSVFLNTTTTGASTPSFSLKTDFNTAVSPYAVAVGDINGDGKPDLVTASQVSIVSVFLNTTTTGASTPTFSARTDFSTDINSQSVSISDLNGDGKLDLVVANSNPNSVSVLFNTTTPGASTPTFTAKTDFTTGLLPYTAAIGDLNGDGKPDLVVPNNSSNTFSVFLNTTSTGAATPSFSAKTDFNTGLFPSWVSIGDLNGDGKPDVAVTNLSENSISVFLNTTTPGASTPTFSANTDFLTGSSPSTVITNDLNNDGKPDLTVVNSNNSSISVFLNTTTPGSSTPTFAAKTDFTTGFGPFSIAPSDFNGDGKTDLAVVNANPGTISVFLNTMTLGVAAPSFSAKTDFTAGTSPRTINCVDFNGDGKPDLAMVNSGSSNLSVCINTTTPGASTPTFTSKTDFTTGSVPWSQAVGDINGDGKPDIVVGNFSSSSMSVFINTTTPGASTPTFSVKFDFTTGTSPFGVAIADFNGDGKKDVAVENRGSNTVSVFLNTTTPGAATPTFTSRTDFTTGSQPRTIAIADFNGDGKPDIVVPNSDIFSGGNTISVFLNTTTPGAATPTFTARTNFATAVQPQSVSVGDFNGDGKQDIVVGNYSTGSVSVFLNTTTPGASTPSFTAKTDFTTGTNPISTNICDVNGDGLQDLVVGYGVNTFTSIYLNTTTPGASTPTFSARTDFTAGTGPNDVKIVDLNGDGRPDLASANFSTNNISVLLNTAVLPLPVELASFTSSVNSNNVTLNWSTTQEQNNKGFEIERNSFGTGWKKIGYVEGHGTINTPQNYIFKDNSLTTGRYSYRLKQIDYNGNFEYFELSNEVAIGVPSKYLLAQNYPNPFNPSSIINYQLEINSFVSLKVYDLAGKEVANLVNEVKDAGYYSVTFDAKNLSSGTYFYKITTDKFSDVKKMVLMK